MENQHINQAFHTASLIRKYAEGTLSASERQELDTWLAADENNRRFFDRLLKSGDAIRYEQSFNEIDTTGALERFKAHYSLADRPERRIRSLFWSAAAVVFVFLSIGLGWFYFKPGRVDRQLLVSQYGDDIPAGGDRATLTLSDGRVVALSSDKQGVVIGEDLTYNDGTSLVSVGPEDDALNNIELTLTTPRGGQYQTTLADGTKVWLNAGSSLTYPMHFAGNERVVILEGEAYFDVSHDANRPFTVLVNDTKIEVLGTEFNVNTYAHITTTLVKGSVKIANATGEQLLMPGQEARVGELENITVKAADVNKAVAWKNGYFYFKSDNVADIMTQLTRWYDVEVIYEGTVPEKGYNGRIRRTVNLSKVLDMLTYLTGAQFTVKDKRVTVTFN